MNQATIVGGWIRKLINKGYIILHDCNSDSDSYAYYYRNQQRAPAHLAAILGAVGGILVVIVIATVGVILVLILVVIAKRRK